MDGVISHTVVPRALTPVREYLKTQDRFSHLFEPEENSVAIAAIQESINGYWREAGAREGFQVKVPEQAAVKAPSS
jgi:pyruvate/2-oxoacid:ferredoxin oxidoreductase beta subunit